VLDFYCHETRLAIELDGDSHIGRAAYDRKREQQIVEQGIRVLRVGNDDILHDMDAVLEGILKACGIAIDQKPLTPALSLRERVQNTDAPQSPTQREPALAPNSPSPSGRGPG